MRAHYADESALLEAAAARDESVREHLTWLIDARSRAPRAGRD